MANKTRSSFEKRQKEVARQARMKEKQAKRLDARQKTAEGETEPESAQADEDPDLAGIILGPQPTPAEDGADDDPGRKGDST